MAESDEVGQLSSRTASNRHHRRSATAFAKLDYWSRAQSSTAASATNPGDLNVNDHDSTDPAPSYHVRLPKSQSSIALGRQGLKPARNVVIRGKDWESLSMQTEKIEIEAKVPWSQQNLRKTGRVKNVDTQQKPTTSLGLSDVQSTLIQSPHSPPSSPDSNTAQPTATPPPYSSPHAPNCYATRMHTIQLRTLLTRCTVLATTVRTLERKPWVSTTTTKRTPYWHYSEILTLAQRANTHAEALHDDPLRARCSYWMGRGWGGMGDFGAAVGAFERAVRLDVDGTDGLRIGEKSDVKYLLGSARKKFEEYRARMADAKAAARFESERSGRPLDECFDWNEVASPWMPDRDRVVEIARREFGARREGGDEMEEEVEKKWKDEGIEWRRVLSEQEWKYIRGQVRRDSATQGGSPGRRASSVDEKDGEDGNVEERTERGKMSLGDELADLSWDGSGDEGEMSPLSME